MPWDCYGFVGLPLDRRDFMALRGAVTERDGTEPWEAMILPWFRGTAMALWHSHGTCHGWCKTAMASWCCHGMPWLHRIVVELACDVMGLS